MKTSVIVVMLLLMISIIVPANAQEFYTIQEIAQQAEAGWHRSYRAHGRDISVRVNVTFPHVNALPVQKLELAFLEPSSQDIDLDTWQVILQPDDSAFGIVNKLHMENYPNTADEITTGSYYTPFLDFHKIYTAKSSITLAMAMEAVCNMLDYIGIDSELFVIEKPWKIHINDYFQKETGIPTQAGMYYLSFYQKSNEIPIFCHVGRVLKNPTRKWFEPHLMAAVYETADEKEEISTLGVKSLQCNEVMIADIPLCSFQTITDSVEKEIDAGHIRKVFDLDLGYILYDDPNHLEAPGGGYYQFFYAVPAWRLNCIYLDNANKEATDYTGKEQFERNSLEYVTLIINAQTGEIEDYRSTQKDRADYKGFISWEDIGGK